MNTLIRIPVKQDKEYREYYKDGFWTGLLLAMGINLVVDIIYLVALILNK